MAPGLGAGACLTVGSELGAEMGLICSASVFSKKRLGSLQLLEVSTGKMGFN